ncbi:hypothetical protein E4T50_03725 [Aureobasidium sp. EXF-12298]|nr:hypothetical protein E4T50_03725 [Aureobasidium sp. EXF-12298]KAI4752583.1 hypothetical protein E4T51_14253 [Aureobasidium sp. EXF-12344]KAI4781650.1 hypothetical protein E4T52_03368 [Aureobasidium sp. EXF-3400]
MGGGGLSFPIVCAAQLSEEIMNRFLEESGIADDENLPFAFIDSIDDYYDGPSEAPVDAPSSPDSPFINKTPEECSQLLLKLCEDTESEIIPHYFIIMDERSTQDGTVLLVTADTDQPVYTVRATFEVSAEEVTLYLTGHASAEEDAERALQEHDNVFRG